MKLMRALGAVAAAAAVWWSCATEKKQVEATSEIIYEDPVDAGPKDPFEGCKAEPQQVGAAGATFNCGSAYTGAFIQVRQRQPLTQAGIDKTLADIEGRFPPDSTKERFTETYGEYQGHGTRVSQDTPVSKFYSENVLVSVTPTTIRIISCTHKGSPDPTRCRELIPELVANGIPERVPGAPPPPVIEPEEPDAGVEDAGTPDAGTSKRRRR